jgi:hypothetical protein
VAAALLAVASRAAERPELAAELSPAVALMAAQAQAASVSAAVVFQGVETAAASAQEH